MITLFQEDLEVLIAIEQAGRYKPEYAKGKIDYYLFHSCDRLNAAGRTPPSASILCTAERIMDVELSLMEWSKPIGITLTIDFNYSQRRLEAG